MMGHSIMIDSRGHFGLSGIFQLYFFVGKEKSLDETTNDNQKRDKLTSPSIKLRKKGFVHVESDHFVLSSCDI